MKSEVFDTDKIQNREDFLKFLQYFREYLEEKPSGWENQTLPGFLEAMEAFVGSLDSYYMNRGENMPEINWNVFAVILEAASIYE